MQGREFRRDREGEGRGPGAQRVRALTWGGRRGYHLGLRAARTGAAGTVAKAGRPSRCPVDTGTQRERWRQTSRTSSVWSPTQTRAWSPHSHTQERGAARGKHEHGPWGQSLSETRKVDVGRSRLRVDFLQKRRSHVRGRDGGCQELGAGRQGAGGRRAEESRARGAGLARRGRCPSEPQRSQPPPSTRQTAPLQPEARRSSTRRKSRLKRLWSFLGHLW